ncbi:MAG: ABC transporter permease [Myxococcales bacterium]|nr:ABC transporter permease [Myxococcales bacterium]
MNAQLAKLRFAIGACARRGGRTAAMMVGLAFITALFASVVFLTDALRHEARLGVSTLPDLMVQRTVAGRPALVDPSHVEALRAMRGVRRVTPRVWGYLYVPSLEANLTIVALHGDGAAAEAPRARSDGRADNGDAVVEGRLPTDAEEVTVGATLAERLGLRVGDEVALPAPERYQLVRVVGLFRAASALRTADVVLAQEPLARTLLGMPEGQYTDLAVDLTVADEAGVVANRAAMLFPGARVLQRSLLERTHALTFDARGGSLAVLLLPALAALLLLAWDRLTGLGEVERREIGVLKAVGWQTSEVLQVRVYEQLVVALTGACAGVAVAYVYVFALGAPGLSGALFGWSALYPELRLAPSMDASVPLTILAAVVLPYVAVGLVPAFRAAVMDPLDAQRGRS